MSENLHSTEQRKKEHIRLCLTDDVSFKNKSNGFENYEFEHYAITEVDLSKISFKRRFFGKEINYPLIISCMTGGTSSSENINAQLALSANELKIPLGVGSQRQALENEEHHSTYKIIRKNAPDIPVLGNIGASQLVKFDSFSPVKFLVNLVEADVMVVHINPVQELIQKNGEVDFKYFLKKLKKLIKFLNVPVIVKEVGAGISKKAAERLLDAGVSGIDVAGSGGTSWSGVEILRNKGDNNHEFWDWGLPTSYCLREIAKLKSKYKFLLIGSGGLYNGTDIAKALALGADMVASARIILQQLDKSGTDGVIKIITGWFEIVKKIMFLTGSQNLSQLRNNKLIRKENLY
jgi:isopentenyl-diphosphate delta-isomerase